MVKIYNGVVIYQNIGSVIIPDGVVDDLTVNNIATINTLHVSDTLGLTDVNLTHGSITSAPVNDNDIVNKKYVDDNESAFEPSEQIDLTHTPKSLTTTGQVDIGSNLDINGSCTINSTSNTDGLKVLYDTVYCQLKRETDTGEDTGFKLCVPNYYNCLKLYAGSAKYSDSSSNGVKFDHSGSTFKGTVYFGLDK